jgi:hypothetical protein
MSDSASGAALTHGSGALCAGGWSGGLDCPHRQKPGPPRDPGRTTVARQDRRERPLVTADGPRRPADAARTAMTTRLEREVDPAGQLQPDQRAALARAAARRLSAQLNAAKARKRMSD